MFGATAANAAPLSPVAPEATSGVELVHGDHRSCRSGPAGWHRHTRGGDRVRCGRSVRVYRTEPSVSIRVGKDRRDGRRDGVRRGDGDRRDGDRRDRR